MSSTIRIVGFTGCLREKSYNKAALRTAQTLLPSHVELELLSINDLPPFEIGQPESGALKLLKEKIRQADAILIATPEYKGLLPNVLKNALSWLAADTAVLAGKPVAVMGIGRQSDSADERWHLRQMLMRSQVALLEQPELYISADNQQVANDGLLTNEWTRQQIRTLIDELAVYASAVQPALVG